MTNEKILYISMNQSTVSFNLRFFILSISSAKKMMLCGMSVCLISTVPFFFASLRRRLCDF